MTIDSTQLSVDEILRLLPPPVFSPTDEQRAVIEANLLSLVVVAGCAEDNHHATACSTYCPAKFRPTSRGAAEYQMRQRPRLGAQLVVVGGRSNGIDL